MFTDNHREPMLDCLGDIRMDVSRDPEIWLCNGLALCSSSHLLLPLNLIPDVDSNQHNV